MADDKSAEKRTLARRSLGRALRLLREKKKLSVAEAATSLGYQRNTIWRIEEGLQGTRKPVVNSLCDLYEAPDEQRAVLLRLLVDGGKPGWWESHKEGMEPKWVLFTEAEQESSVIWVWEPELIPGLLQVPAYVHALQSVQGVDPKVASAVREFRAERQKLIFRGRRGRREPRMRFLIGGAALRHLDAVPDVQAQQLERLHEVARLPNVEIRIATGLHPCMYGAFTILTPGPSPETDPPFAYVESLDGARYVEDPRVVSRFEQAHAGAFDLATPLEEHR